MKRSFSERAKRFLKRFMLDPEVREYIRQELGKDFAPKSPTEENIERLYRELVRLREESEKRWQEYLKDREESQKRWEENQKRWEEQKKLWEENQRRWEENQRRWEKQKKLWEENQKRWEEQAQINRELLQEIKSLRRLYDTGIGALGARWGLRAESTFREAIKAILEEDFPVKVERYLAEDEEGYVFGRPDQVELDLIIRDGRVLVAEIKSSVSKGDMYILKKKVEFYQKKEGKKPDRVLVISPMVEDRAKELAQEYGFEVYSYPVDIENL